VRLINTEGEVSVCDTEEALRLAHEADLDLVEINPREDPPVCKIMDLGKYLYKQQKLIQNQKKNVKKVTTKEVRISYNTEKHDLEFKVKQARDFIAKGHLVKLSLIMRGREASHKDLALEKVNLFLAGVDDLVAPDRKIESLNTASSLASLQSVLGAKDLTPAQKLSIIKKFDEVLGLKLL
jgi:translation initiation factor IF-3